MHDFTNLEEKTNSGIRDTWSSDWLADQVNSVLHRKVFFDLELTALKKHLRAIVNLRLYNQKLLIHLQEIQ